MGIENINEIDEKFYRIKVVRVVAGIMSRFAITTTQDTDITNLAHFNAV